MTAPSDMLALLVPPAVVLDASGRIMATNDAWMGATPTRARTGVDVGAGADYLGAARRAAGRGDLDAAAVVDRLEELLDGRLGHAEIDYPCPSPTAHQWFRLTMFRLNDPCRVLLVHTRTDPPSSGLSDEPLSDGIAHDLINRLHAAGGLVSTLLEHGERSGPGKRQQMLEAAQRQLGRAMDDLARVRDRPAGPPPAAAPQAVPLHRAVQEAQESTGVACVTRLDDDLMVQCDPDHLVRVLVNLLGNSAKYGQPPVGITGHRRGHRIHLDVSDQGDGIPADIAERLFQPGSRGSIHQDGPRPGTGQGLAIVQQLLRANGATILHRPELPGAGFRLDLPAAMDLGDHL